MLKHLVTGMRDAGAEVEIVHLRNKTIKNCISCFACYNRKDKKCSHKDDMTAELIPKWLESDLVIYATPVYFHTINAALKTFIERTFPLYLSFDETDTEKSHLVFNDKDSYPAIAFISVSGFHHYSAFNVFSHYVNYLYGSKLVAEIYRTSSALLPFCKEKGSDVFDATIQAGRELVRFMKIAPETMARIKQPLHDDPQFIANIGTALFPEHKISISDITGNQSHCRINLSELIQREPEKVMRYFNVMVDSISKETIRPAGYKTFPSVQIHQAYETMQDRKNIGKVVVTLPGSKSLDDGTTAPEAIAIIGMSGRFAKSKTLKDLWRHLAKGTDLIEEVSRWDFSQYYPDSSGEEKNYCNHGSFLEDIDKFDPLFFNISGVEASYMDPQQRFFLEESWKAIEDAGYAGTGVQGRKCGVYVGCGPGDYRSLFGDNPPAQAFWGNASSVIPARIAYYLDLQGPALAVDTACSSSLVALHLACQGLWAGETELALAGGVFIQSTPGFYLAANRAGMLSPSGRCSTFDQRADGFVPGEGVGVVVLKRLKEAIADHDHIYGVIRGSGINQDGTTNGITAPSANSQERLQRFVYDTFNINPGQFQMVEAHGTGTILGDPIEVEALTRAFGKYMDKKEYCAIGSIKTNLGHAVSAAGVAGLIKVLLALQNKQIPPSLHYQKANPNIRFKGSPFYVNTSLKDWDVEPNAARCAVISSFGFSGTNAHVVIAEAPKPGRRHREKPGYLIVLSARTFEQLHRQMEQIVEFCEQESGVDCGNMSYTLLLGRKHLEHRLAGVVRSREELVKLFKKWLEKGKVSQIYVSHLQENDYRQQPALKRYGNQCIQNCRNTTNAGDYLEHLAAIADLYVQGYALEFEQLFSKEPYSRISLPTYPFDNGRYWVPGPDDKSAGSSLTATSAAYLHPLLHQNTADLFQLRFSSTFTGREFFLADHIVKGQRVLPGVAYLEMARAALTRAAGASGEDQVGIRLENVVWTRPITVEEEEVRVHIGLFPGETDNRQITYEIYSDPEAGEAEPVVHCQGNAVLGAIAEVPTLDLTVLQAECSRTSLSPGQCYEAFKMMGVEHGPGYQGVKAVYVGENQVLAKLSLPSSVSGTGDQFVLHPSMLDSALQASIGLITGPGDTILSGSAAPPNPVIPFVLQEFEILGNCTSGMWALVRTSGGSKAGDRVRKLDIDLCDDQGTVCVRMKGLSFREMDINHLAAGGKSGTLMLRPCWREQATPRETTVPAYSQHIVIFCEPEERWKMGSEEAGFKIIQLQSKQQAIEKRFQIYAARVFAEIQSILKDKPGGKVLIQVVVPIKEEQQLFSGLSGLLKTAQLENPNLIGQLVEVEPGEDSKGILEKLEENSRCPGDAHIRYQDGKRRVAGWTDNIGLISPIGPMAVPWKDHGIYLITGGLGSLGLLFAKEIAQQVKDTTLILIGRSPLGEDRQAKLKELQALGARAQYRQVDVTQKQAVTNLIRSIREDFGSLNGIIHCAGVIRDNFILKKTKDELQEVLAPKVPGLVHLDQASKELNLDLFILFSSLAGAVGNPGQADYSTANAFMDAYAGYRNALVTSKKRHGQTLSINWPLWKEGGMHVDEETEKMLKQSMGMMAMQTPNGIRALYRGLASGKDQVLVMEGDVPEMRELFLKTTPTTPGPGKAPTVSPSKAGIDAGTWLDKVKTTLKQAVSQLLQVEIEDIDADTRLNEYGFDPIKLAQLANKLNQEYKLELTPTIFFEHPDLHGFAKYLVEEYEDVFEERFGQPLPAVVSPVSHGGLLLDKVKRMLTRNAAKLLRVKPEAINSHAQLNKYGFDSIIFTEFANKLNREYKLKLTPANFFEYPTLHDFAEYLIKEHRAVLTAQFAEQAGVETAVPVIETEAKKSLTNKKQRSRFQDWDLGFARKQQGRRGQVEIEPAAIAVIGMSGVMPQSENLDIFWKHLEAGEDLITKIPRERWELGDMNEVAWGGFMKEVDKFDALFFGISPLEAELMDPQQRIFLETAWKTIEDAGYRVSDLSGTRTGVFVGVSTSDYGDIIRANEVKVEPHLATGMSHCVLANRISYLFNFHGPSEPIDTACSSALIAVHRAVESIRGGNCEMAIAGGVNVLLSPAVFISFSKAGMLSPDGRCKTFDKRADGYVRGEGSGAVFLKPLARAIKDGDHIYAVIKGTAVNHGGHASSLTAPNPVAQADLLIEAYERAGIDPSTVTYIEAHGTGTSLGDPVEINGLKRAFAELYKRRGQSPRQGYCGIGSVKTNIGHLEAAAGIAGLLKVLLAMKHKKLPANVHFKELNPYIQLENSPFYILNETRPWENFPRRAGVSSFGFGGANAHLVLEEYKHPVSSQDPPIREPQIIVLSARNEERLKTYARNMVDFLGKNESSLTSAASGQSDQNDRNSPPSPLNLPDIAYTLQVGRKPMEERLAVIAPGIREVRESLTRYCQEDVDGDGDIENLFHGNLAESKSISGLLLEGNEGREYLNIIFHEKKFEKLAKLWVSGVDIDWELLYRGNPPNRVSLPTYPFARERYWVAMNKPIRKPGAEISPTQEQHGESSEIPPPAVVENDGKSYRDILFAHEPGQRKEMLTSFLSEKIARMLRLSSTQKLDPGQPLVNVGLDSLMALQLKKEIEVDLRMNVSMIKFLGGESAADMAGLLLRHLVDNDQNKETGISPTTKMKAAVDLDDLQNEGNYITKVYPLSHQQRALWYIYQSAPDSPAYNTALPIRLLFEVDIPVLQSTLQTLLVRHPGLRTTFSMQDGQPLQQVHAHQEVFFRQIDASSWSMEQFKQKVKETHECPFDLEKGPLMRVTLFTRGPKDHVVLISIHHIVCDGWSMWTLSEELWKAYLVKKAVDPGNITSLQARQIRRCPGDIPSLIESMKINTDSFPGGIPAGSADTTTDARKFREFIQLLLLKTFQRMGVFQTGGETYDKNRLREQLDIVPGYYRLFDALLDLLARGETIQIKGSEIITGHHITKMDAETGTGTLEKKKNEIKKKYADMEAYVNLVRVCVNAFPEILTGKKSHMEVMFPDGSMELVEKTYQGNQVVDYFNHLVAEIVKTYIQDRLREDKNANIRILEVGAGTGGTSQFVLEAIADDGKQGQVHYLYTDISAAFSRYGERLFAQKYPFVEFKTLDIEKDPEPQGFKPDSIDILFASHVIHATRRIETSLSHIKGLLKTNGLVLINEVTQLQDVLTLTFGLTDGWWLFQDDENRIKGSPLLDRQQWEKLLADSGFRKIKFFGLPGSAHSKGNDSQHVMAAESDGIIKTRNLPAETSQMGLEPLKHTYEDYVRWQARMLEGEEGERQWHYWQQQLAGELPVLNLPLDRPRPTVQTFRGNWIPFRVKQELSRQLLHFAREKGITLVTLLSSAYLILVHRCTGQDDILVGCPTTGRPHQAFDGIVGDFVNTVVLRADFSHDPTVELFLNRMRQTLLDAFDHQDYPFGLLVDRLNPGRDPGRPPVFQTMFVFQKPHQVSEFIDVITDFYTSSARVKIHDLDFESFPISQQEGQFDMSIEMTGSGESLKGVFKYNRDLFDHATIERMANHFLLLLERIVTHPGQQVSQIRFINREEKNRLLQEWNDTRDPEVVQNIKCLHQLFADQVNQSPDAAALLWKEQSLNYTRLNRQANQLARYLIKNGVKPEDRIGICIRRSFEMMIGLMGILKAGGVVVPLDPYYPGERLAMMIEDSQLSILLTNHHLVDLFQPVSQNENLTVIDVDNDGEIIARESAGDLAANVSAENLLYILYTSGSTGTPKGVEMPHQPIANLILWQNQRAKLPPPAITLQFTTLSFDVSFQEIFSTLCSGGTLLLIPEELRQDPLALLKLMKEAEVQRIFVPFVFLQMLAEASENNDELLPSSLRQIITAGEQLRITRPIVNLFKKLNHCTLYNQYGPTEAHVVTAYTLQGQPDEWPLLPPIGKPIANTRIYILDKHSQLVPIGVTGEIFIGGICLARGYRHQPELTKEKFVKDPFANNTDRLYRTGDLGRFLVDGNIEFLGRRDHQVKIRGFRVEPAEIENQLLNHEEVSDVVVIDRENKDGIKSLAAYIVTPNQKELPVKKLKDYLAGKLPGYMIPAYFVQMDKIPLLPNKKVDYLSLPRPDVTIAAGTEYAPPGDEVEEKLAGIWQEILDMEKIGINDNLFDIGGNSLITLSLQKKIEELYPGKIKIPDLIQYPTIAALAKVIKTREASVPQKSEREEQLQTLLEAISGDAS
jgi:amino acid adenylation domain-containing protein